jgi:hypothetical protein
LIEFIIYLKTIAQELKMLTLVEFIAADD